jgi:hypothetical protein
MQENMGKPISGAWMKILAQAKEIQEKQISRLLNSSKFVIHIILKNQFLIPGNEKFD